MKVLRETIEEVLKEGRGSGVIYWKASDFDPNDPSILISGYGVLTYSRLEKNIIDSFSDMSKQSTKGNLYSLITKQLLDDNSAFITKLKAYIDVTDELKQPKIKRKITVLKNK